MASFHESAASLFLVALALLQVTNPSSAAHLSGGICSKAEDPAFCLQVMKSIPGAARAASLKSLGQTAIKFSYSKGEETLNYIRSLEGSVKDPVLKRDYGLCAESYVLALKAVEDARGMFKSRDYFGVSSKASGCMFSVVNCEDFFEQPPTADPSKLPEKNKYFNTLCEIILIVANKLSGA